MDEYVFKGELGKLYNPTDKKVVIVDVPEMNFIMIDGEVNPDNSPVTEPLEEMFYLE